MHIICPTCSASYEVPDQLMTAGRVVRCSRCNGEWTPLAPEASPEPEPLAPSPSMEPAPSMEPEAPQPPPQTPEPAEAETIGVVRQSAMARLAAHPATARPSVALRLAWAGSLLVLILLIALAFAWRREIIALWPPSARAYSALGLHAQPEAKQ